MTSWVPESQSDSLSGSENLSAHFPEAVPQCPFMADVLIETEDLLPLARRKGRNPWRTLSVEVPGPLPHNLWRR
jgi:hypothetical protein